MGLTDIALNLAGQFAPGLLRGLLGDNNKETAEKIINIGRALTGGNVPDADIPAAIAADPELAHKFRSQTQALEAEIEIAYMAHTENARQRDLERSRLGLKNTRADVLAYTSIALFAVLIGVIIFAPIEDEWTRTTVAVALGILGTKLNDVFNFEFGSSKGSKEKAEQLSRRDNA